MSFFETRQYEKKEGAKMSQLIFQNRFTCDSN